MNAEFDPGPGTDGEDAFFQIAALEPRTERWRQFLVLVVGVGTLWLGHEVARRAVDPWTTRIRLFTGGVVVVGLFLVGRAVSRFMNSLTTSQARVFRWRHQAVCGVVVLAVAVLLCGAALTRDPFSPLFSRGQISATDIADAGFFVAAGLCLVGAIAAFIAAGVERRAEHDWSSPPSP